MNRFFSIMIISLFITGCAWAQDDHAGTIKKVKGDVRINHNGTVDKAVVGRHVFSGDRVTTGKNAAMGLSFMEGTRISLGDASDMTITAFAFKPQKKQYAFDVYLKKGTAVYTSGKLGKLKPEKVKFRTPKAVVGVRGTKFLIKAE